MKEESIVNELCIAEKETMINVASGKSVATLNDCDALNKSAATPNIPNLMVHEFIKASEMMKSDLTNCQLDYGITDEELLEAALMLEAKNAAIDKID